MEVIIILSLSITAVVLLLAVIFFFLPQYAKKTDLEREVNELKKTLTALSDAQIQKQEQLTEQLSAMIRQLEQSTDKKIVGLEHRRVEDNQKSKQEIIEHFSNGLSKLENIIREPLL